MQPHTRFYTFLLRNKKVRKSFGSFGSFGKNGVCRNTEITLCRNCRNAEMPKLLPALPHTDLLIDMNLFFFPVTKNGNPYIVQPGELSADEFCTEYFSSLRGRTKKGFYATRNLNHTGINTSTPIDLMVRPSARSVGSVFAKHC